MGDIPRRTLRSGELPAGLSRALEGDLVTALGRGEIEVLFQPQFSCADGRMVGAEALARWQHPTLGEIGARDLFHIAEKAHLVAPLSRQVVAQAMQQASQWPEHLGLALNITPEELAERSFAQDFASGIGRSNIAPSRLTLEITEDVLLRDLDLAAEALAALRHIGLRVALDDFGAGFCNFRYLKELPLDAIKLDRSMVVGICRDERDLAVLRAIVGLAHAMGLEVVAEGIETEAQRDAVIAEGCSYWQGFLRAAPMRNDDMLRMARG
ncbi:EAL domain-containing protein [Altererythrobacter arenosus]|uniref:EAL domain-containing protein n=1 Tax=Altererythrobacter arenosus TaxID=3032592 RepID=A0ABY8FPC7_9SPHN|nr:EAL domain-containing protein [Altererythrobacter sp. CAU 1644]WFL76856.1 EAL domain-containing protein [Altererythrobacter sp. CAU 1644]